MSKRKVENKNTKKIPLLCFLYFGFSSPVSKMAVFISRNFCFSSSSHKFAIFSVYFLFFFLTCSNSMLYLFLYFFPPCLQRRIFHKYWKMLSRIIFCKLYFYWIWAVTLRRCEAIFYEFILNVINLDAAFGME